MEPKHFLTVLLLFLVLMPIVTVGGQMAPLSGTVYSFGTGKGTAFQAIEITCPGMTDVPGQIMLEGQKILINHVRELAFPKQPYPAFVIKLKDGRTVGGKVKKSDVPFCVFSFRESDGGILPLDSFDIDRIVFK